MNGKDAAQKFREMADRIERNAEEFAGGFLLIPPDVEGMPGEPVDGLLVTTKPAIASFWAAAQGQVDLAVATLQDGTRQAGRR